MNLHHVLFSLFSFHQFFELLEINAPESKYYVYNWINLSMCLDILPIIVNIHFLDHFLNLIFIPS